MVTVDPAAPKPKLGAACSPVAALSLLMTGQGDPLVWRRLARALALGAAGGAAAF